MILRNRDSLQKNEDRSVEHMKVYTLRNKTLEKQKICKKQEDLWCENKNEKTEHSPWKMIANKYKNFKISD